MLTRHLSPSRIGVLDDIKAEGILTEAHILMELVDPSRATLSPQVAKEFLAPKFNDDATNRISELLDKNAEFQPL